MRKQFFAFSQIFLLVDSKANNIKLKNNIFNKCIYIFFNTNITTGIKVAEARGVIIMKAYSMGVKVAEYTPLQVKQAIVGYGRAEKKQVISMVTMFLKLEKKFVEIPNGERIAYVEKGKGKKEI